MYRLHGYQQDKTSDAEGKYVYAIFSRNILNNSFSNNTLKNKTKIKKCLENNTNKLFSSEKLYTYSETAVPHFCYFDMT